MHIHRAAIPALFFHLIACPGRNGIGEQTDGYLYCLLSMRSVRSLSLAHNPTSLR
jgi:hypothetical protein